MSPEDFVKRLESISVMNGIPYKRAHLLFEKEEDHVNAVMQFQGYLALSDAFKCFFFETIELLNIAFSQDSNISLSEFYSLFIPRITNSFQTLCGAERVAIKGYPYIGYATLRNIFDNLVLTSAALQKITDFYSIEGVEPGRIYVPHKAKKMRKKIEYEIRNKMTGNQSGLSPDTIAEIAEWDAMYDAETHGSRLSRIGSMNWMKGLGPLDFLPKFDELAFAMFMNRFCEIAWMAHRLIPLMQPNEALLSEIWQKKWGVLDECFEATVLALTKQLGKQIGSSIAEFVKIKFPFTAKSFFSHELNK